MPAASRRVRPISHIPLIPGALYTTEQAMTSGGLGLESLRQARRHGAAPVRLGGRLYYRGEDLICYVLSQGEPHGADTTVAR